MLVRTKRAGLVTYGDLGEGLFRAFGQKWADLTTEKQQALLGSVDPSSLADYGYCYEVVDEMRYIPLSRDGFVTIGLAVVLPFLPLILIQSFGRRGHAAIAGAGGLRTRCGRKAAAATGDDLPRPPMVDAGRTGLRLSRPACPANAGRFRP